MRIKYIYLLLFLIGTFQPLSEFYRFLTSYGLDFYKFIDLLFANEISSFFAWDVIISTLVVILFVLYETFRRPVKYFWLSFIGLLLAGVSSGLPLFLYLRELSLED